VKFSFFKFPVETRRFLPNRLWGWQGTRAIDPFVDANVVASGCRAIRARAEKGGQTLSSGDSFGAGKSTRRSPRMRSWKTCFILRLAGSV